MPMMLGSTPTVAQPTSRAIGDRPRAFAPASEARITAAPPSTMPLAFPAVTVPSFENAVGSFASALERRVGPHVIVTIDDRRAASRLDLDRRRLHPRTAPASTHRPRSFWLRIA